MYRVALALTLGMALLLVAYGQFKGLPGHVDDSPSLAAVIQEALVACTSERRGRTLSAFPRLHEPSQRDSRCHDPYSFGCCQVCHPRSVRLALAASTAGKKVDRR